MTSLSRALIALLMMGLTAFGAGAVRAHEVGPMRLFLTPAEGRTQATITINNTRDEPLPVEMKTFLRVTEADGTERLEPADGTFIIFPPQVQVPARATQAVRIQYAGPPVTDRSLSYVVQVAEVPVESSGFSGVRFTYNFGVAVYVEPPRAVERLEIVSSERVGDGLRVVVRNSGSKFGLLNLNRLVVSVDGQRFDLGGDDLAERIANPLLPPGMDRIVDIHMPELPAGGAITAEIRSR